MVTPRDWSQVRELLAAGVAAGVFPGCSLIVGRSREILLEESAGRLGLEDGDRAVSGRTLYDLASLTKPLLTTSCVMMLVSRGSLGLDDALVRWIPAFAGEQAPPVRRLLSVRDLLSHCSGLPAHRPYFAAMDPAQPDRAAVVVAAVAEDLEQRSGHLAVYSDIGFILLGELIEIVSGRSLGEFAAEELFGPLGLEIGFHAGSEGEAVRPGSPDIAPCGHCSWRGSIVHGTVQDENAHAMGGAAGHAGLFADVRQVHTLVAEYVEAAAGRGRVLDSALVREFWSRRRGPLEAVAGEPSDRPATWALGWDTPSPGVSSAGTFVSADAVGHLGYTGTSVWVDRDRGVHVVLLSNRVHPNPANEKIKLFRPKLHDAVFSTLDASGRGA